MNRFLVTGANGQVGFELQRSLALHGQVVAVTRADADLTDPAAIRALVARVQPSVVINPAAHTAVDQAELEPALADMLNVTAPRVLAESARACGAAFVHFSTDYVFDGSGTQPRHEDEVTAPLSVYGRTKRDGELAVLAAYAGSDLPHYILRTSWVFGAHGNNFVKTMLRLAQQRESLSVVADQVGAPTSAALLADLVTLMLLKQPVSGVYHATAAGETSWHGLARHVIACARDLGLPIKVTPDAIAALTTTQYPTPAQRPLNSRLSTGKLRAALGITLPEWTLAAEQTTDILVNAYLQDRSLQA